MGWGTGKVRSDAGAGDRGECDGGGVPDGVHRWESRDARATGRTAYGANEPGVGEWDSEWEPDQRIGRERGTGRFGEAGDVRGLEPDWWKAASGDRGVGEAPWPPDAGAGRGCSVWGTVHRWATAEDMDGSAEARPRAGSEVGDGAAEKRTAGESEREVLYLDRAYGRGCGSDTRGSGRGVQGGGGQALSVYAPADRQRRRQWPLGHRSSNPRTDTSISHGEQSLWTWKSRHGRDGRPSPDAAARRDSKSRTWPGVLARSSLRKSRRTRTLRPIDVVRSRNAIAHAARRLLPPLHDALRLRKACGLQQHAVERLKIAALPRAPGRS